LSRHPESAEAQWELGYAYRYAGLLEESLELSRRAMASNPGFHDLYSFSLAQLYLGDYRGMLVNEELVKGNAYLTFYRGLAHYYLKEFPQAKAAFDSAYDLGRKQLQARIGKALSYGLEKKTQAGLALLAETEQIISRGGNTDPEGIYRLAQGYAVLGDKAAALRSLQRSIEGGFFCYPYLRDDPLLKNIRNEPQVASLLETARQRHEAFVRQFAN
jgi:tetratricopeptide (TPR) repeat protein